MRTGRRLLFSLVALGLVASSAPGRATELSKGLDAAVDRLTAKEKTQLGVQITQLDRTLFGGALAVRAFERGLLFAALHDGDVMVEKLFLQKKSPKQPPHGDIRRLFYAQGGKRTFGTPLEGEHSLFGDVGRLHVFRKAIIVWAKKDRAVQSIIFERQFR